MKTIRVRTFDSMTRGGSRKTLDTLLDVPTDAEMAKYFAARAKADLGRVWDGVFKPMLEAMDQATRNEVLTNVKNYELSLQSGSMEIGPAGSLTSTRDNMAKASLRQWRDATTTLIDDINERNRKFYGQPSLR
jgi:hypothetical protein